MELKKTISTIFMVPTLGIDKEHLQRNNFINGYVKDAGREEQYENSVYVLFRPRDLDYFKDFVDGEYDRTPHIIDDYDYPEGFVVLVYELNKKFERDFQLIKQGKYSRTSKEFQAFFPKVKKVVKNGKYKDELSLQFRIFTKDETLKMFWEDKIAVAFKDHMELWEGFDEKNETLDVEKIKELI